MQQQPTQQQHVTHSKRHGKATSDAPLPELPLPRRSPEGSGVISRGPRCKRNAKRFKGRPSKQFFGWLVWSGSHGLWFGRVGVAGLCMIDWFTYQLLFFSIDCWCPRPFSHFFPQEVAGKRGGHGKALLLKAQVIAHDKPKPCGANPLNARGKGPLCTASWWWTGGDPTAFGSTDPVEVGFLSMCWWFWKKKRRPKNCNLKIFELAGGQRGRSYRAACCFENTGSLGFQNPFILRSLTEQPLFS